MVGAARRKWGSRLPVRGAEEVADVANRLDALRAVGQVAELAAQAVDATVHGSIRPVVVEAAQRLEDIVARKDLPGVFRQEPENVEFGRREIHRFVLEAHFTRSVVDLE